MKCADVYNLFFQAGEVTEIRAYGLSRQSKAWEGWAGGAGIVYGYFDNPEAFGQAAEALEKEKAPGIYFTLNPCVPDLLARAANRLRAADAKSPSTADKDILCIRWLPIDFDPLRPSGISSSDEELAAAITLRNKVSQWIKKDRQGPQAIPAVSGNGAHLVLRFQDLPNDDESKELVRQCLAAIAAKFNNKKVEIDQAVFNPARIWKVYGTTARKGDSVPTRPHRKSYIEPKYLEAK